MRSFTNQKLTDDTLRQLIEAGCWAPSGSNAQAWQFVVLRQPEHMKKVLRFSPGLFSVPPAMIFVCIDKERAHAKGGELGRDVMSLFDAAMATQNIMLHAHSMGLGTCVLRGFNQRAIQVLLGLPELVVPELLIILGFPKMVPQPPARRPLEQIMHMERWGS